MEVSVLIPTYNRAGLIGDTIKSILLQTHSDFELIIYDDGSTDTTPDIVKSFSDPRIRYIKCSTNNGVQYARNKLLEACKTKYAAWSGSDDLSNIHRLEIQLDYIKSTNRVIVGTNYIGFQDTPWPGTPAFKVVSTAEAYKLYLLPPEQAIPEAVKYPHGGDGTNMVDAPRALQVKYKLNRSLGGGDCVWMADVCTKYRTDRPLIPQVLYYVRYHEQRIGRWKKNPRLNPGWYNRMKAAR